MSLIKKSAQIYLILSGIIFNLGLGYGIYNFGKILLSYNSLPSALTSAASKFENRSSLKPIANSLISISKFLDTQEYHQKPFNKADWPMVGPKYNLATEPSKLPSKAIVVSTTNALLKALKNAEPGHTIILENGDYSISGKRINISKKTPSKQHPITLKAKTPGNVRLLMNTIEGIYLNQPYWKVTGLRFIGKCTNDNKCEHAIHVVGKANNAMISDNEFVNFNAAIKVNAVKNYYPDNGIISHNHFYSTRPRDTSRSVTPVNIDHASNWIVSHNIIRDFIKAKGNKVSYGAFIKGGSKGGVFENNLVACNTTNKGYPGSYIGLSVGGGGMAKRRDNAKYEADGVTIRNNIIFHCSDVGIYVNKGKNTLINNNTLYNTSGIDVRFPETSSTVINNLFSGDLRLRDKAKVISDTGNILFSRGYIHNGEQLSKLFVSPANGNFTFKEDSIDINKNAADYPLNDANQVTDFCGTPLGSNDRFIGAFSKKTGCFHSSGESNL